MVAVMNDEVRRRPDALRYAEYRLKEWAVWSKEHRNELGYPTISLLYKAMKQKADPITKLKNGSCLTARGSETHVFVEPTVGEPPDHVAEVEIIVSRLPKDLHTVIVADYFTYGPIEVRSRQTRWRRARYCQLLESAKYAVYAALDSRTPMEVQGTVPARAT